MDNLTEAAQAMDECELVDRLNQILRGYMGIEIVSYYSRKWHTHYRSQESEGLYAPI